MVISAFRREMLIAFSVPIAIFFVVPFALALAVAPLAIAVSAESVLFFLIVVAPIYATGLFLAPWAGRRVGTTKTPAFFMSIGAALSSALTVGAFASAGSVELGAAIAGSVAFFAVPGSVLGALLFIGGCTRLPPVICPTPRGRSFATLPPN